MLEHFRARITELLTLPQQVDHGRVNPSLLHLSPEAKQVWIAFHDEVEVQLVEDGELHNVRDVASKIADNAARLAALFHVIEDGTGNIDAHIMANACRIARWHLNESRRLLNTPATPAANNAQVLDRWLVEKFKQKAVTKMSFTDILKHGPSRLRDKALLERALAALNELKRAKLVDGVPRMVHINPALVQG
jgi:putative DNA primase/helicase